MVLELFQTRIILNSSFNFNFKQYLELVQEFSIIKVAVRSNFEFSCFFPPQNSPNITYYTSKNEFAKRFLEETGPLYIASIFTVSKFAIEFLEPAIFR